MAVAVKNTPEVASASLLDRMAIASLAGAAYVLGTLGIVFALIPSLWQSLGWEGNTALMVRILIQLAALVGLVVFGTRLLAGGGVKSVPGVRAGMFIDHHHIAVVRARPDRARRGKLIGSHPGRPD